jgi:hypothetical protein
VRDAFTALNLRLDRVRVSKFSVWRQSVVDQDTEILDGIVEKSNHIGALLPRERKHILRSGKKFAPHKTEKLGSLQERLMKLGQLKDRIPKTSLKIWMNELGQA